MSETSLCFKEAFSNSFFAITVYILHSSAFFSHRVAFIHGRIKIRMRSFYLFITCFVCQVCISDIFCRNRVLWFIHIKYNLHLVCDLFFPSSFYIRKNFIAVITYENQSGSSMDSGPIILDLQYGSLFRLHGPNTTVGCYQPLPRCIHYIFCPWK